MHNTSVRHGVHIILRPAFGVFLFLSQFMSHRDSFFTESAILLAVGIVLIAAGIRLWIRASKVLRKAMAQHEIAVLGPYKYVRHPIYVSIYLFSFGLGCMFFAWLWFGVLLVFLPLWYVECKLEEHDLIKTYGQRYEIYQKGTGMFIPRVA